MFDNVCMRGNYDKEEDSSVSSYLSGEARLVYRSKLIDE